MTFKIFSTVPSNPEQFFNMVALSATKKIAILADNEFIRLEGQIKNHAICVCAYGYFFVSLNKKFSKKFYSSKKDCLDHLKKMI